MDSCTTPRRLRARNGEVLVSMQTQDMSEDGRHYKDPNTGLYMGREVAQPIGVVIASGTLDINVGQKVVCVRDLGRAFEWEGMSVQRVKANVRCPRCGTLSGVGTDLAAIKHGPSWRPPTGRVLVEPLPTYLSQELITVGETRPADLCWGVDIYDKDRRVAYHEGSGIAFTDDGRGLVSLRVREHCPKCGGQYGPGEVLAVEEG